MISPSSPSLEPVPLQKPTVLTAPLSLNCTSVSMFRPQLCIDAEARQNCDEKAPKQPQSRPHDCVYSPLEANTAPTLQRFVPHPIFRAKMVNTIPCDMPVASTISRTLIHRPLKTIL